MVMDEHVKCGAAGVRYDPGKYPAVMGPRAY